MKRFALLLILAMIISSCVPRVFYMNLDIRKPSPSGMDIAGKSIAVVYLNDKTAKDTVFNKSIALGFKSSLEKDYFNGKAGIDLWSLDRPQNGKQISIDTLRSLVMKTGKDVIFLFDVTPDKDPHSISLCLRHDSGKEKADSADVLSATFSANLKLYAYDSMGKDTLRTYSEKGMLIMQNIYASKKESMDKIKENIWSKVPETGIQTGKEASKIFSSKWKTEDFMFIYYDSPEDWENGIEAAYKFRWKESMSYWMNLLNTDNMEKRSSAEYNIANICYILGDYKLALKWLDMSDKDFHLLYSDNLRFRIKKTL